MAGWNDYKKYAKEKDPRIAEDMNEIEEISRIVGTIIERRHEMGLSQRDLAELCEVPQSSVARIESGKSSPNLTTLVKIFRELRLKMNVSKVEAGKISDHQ